MSAQIKPILILAEVDKLLDEAAGDDENEVDIAIEVNWLNAFENGIIIGSPGGPSGGYAEYIVRRFISDSKVDRMIIRRTQK